MPARRLPHAVARALCCVTACVIAAAACAGGPPPGTTPLPADAHATAETAPLLVCAAEVAAEVGMPVIERRAERGELRALSVDPRGATASGAAPTRLDVVTVRIGSKVSQGLRVLVQSFRRRAARPDAPAGWDPEPASSEAALARDTILRRCGTLQDRARR